jgi:hypothetical protein
MQLKVESEPSTIAATQLPQNHDQPHTSSHSRANRTSSIYISSTNSSNNQINNENGNDVILNESQAAIVDCRKSIESQQSPPVLTIQVNQNTVSSSSSNNNNNNHCNENANNLVNIVSCFRASTATTTYPTTITHNGIEANVVQHNNCGNNSQFNVSVNRNNYKKCSNSNSNDESVNNENNQNIVNIVECVNVMRNHVKIQSTNVDYQNQSGVNGLTEMSSNIINDTGTNNNSVTNDESEITIVSTANTQAPQVESVNNQQQLQQQQNCDKIDVDNSTQTMREQRRRERRERRQRRAQHGHHRHHQHHSSQQQHVNANVAVHQRINRVESSTSRVNGYEMLPDIINNHLPPPYTTLPLHALTATSVPTPIPLPQSSLIAAANVVSPVPVVVDDCRFSFPIPIIRR